ncbi:MAG: membrane protein insertase YidC [Psychromonas sp.]|nr:membrane protein insertase YidC [Psychromonas sp.]
MESQRNLLLLAFVFVSFLLYQAWEVDHKPTAEVQTTKQDVKTDPTTLNQNEDVPASSLTTTKPVVKEVPLQENVQVGKSIFLTNDTLRLSISLKGGDIVKSDLLKYSKALHSKEPFDLLRKTNNFTYIAQSGLIGQGPDSNPKGRPTYTATNSNAVMKDGQNKVSTSLRFVDKNGNVFTKTFTLTRGDYVVNVSYKIQNISSKPLNVQLYGQLRETMKSPKGHLAMPIYHGGAYSTTETRYEKYKFSKMKETPLKETTKGGWVAMLQHYFVSAWIPATNETNQFYSNIIRGTDATIGFKAPIKTIKGNSITQISTKLWVGPKLQSKMAAAAKHLDLTVDYGWLWFIAQPLFKLLRFFHGIVGNWGLAIILITFTIKGALYPLTKAQYTSMAKMRLLQPKIKSLRDRYGDDKQKMSKATMELYKKEKVNPLGGCLPIFLQMPIFIALYWSLMEAVELRHAPFILWIQDLSVQDPYYILPILMGVSMFFIQQMSPATVQDPMQQKIMKLMPVLFTFFFLWFPAGLVLYYLVSNIVTLIQQKVIFRQIERQGIGTPKLTNKAKDK